MTDGPRLTQLLARASRALTRQGDDTLKPLGLRYAQVPVVVLLRTHGPLTQRDLADAVGIEQPSMAELLARMDRDGLITRTPHPADGRSRSITLADGQQDRISEAQRRLADLESQATNGLDTREVALFGELLQRVTANLGGTNQLLTPLGLTATPTQAGQVDMKAPHGTARRAKKPETLDGA